MEVKKKMENISHRKTKNYMLSMCDHRLIHRRYFYVLNLWLSYDFFLELFKVLF